MELKAFLFLLLCPFYLSAQDAKPKKFALLIGISHFEDTSWSALHGKEDVETLAHTLRDKGFPNENIIVCTDEQATKDQILSLFDGLQTQVEPGSMVYLHFSTHGQQILDDNTNPKEESDGLDECLIPYDCPFIKSEEDIAPEKAYKGNKHLRDDVIGILTNNLRDKIGSKGQLVVVIDACHSGTATRSFTTMIDIKPLWFGVKPPGIKVERVNRLNGEGGMSSSTGAPMLAIFASLPGESALDKVLSNVVNEALKSATPYTTCGDFFKDIVSKTINISSLLTPNQEGLDKLSNAYLFGGSLKPPISYFEVEKVSQEYVKLSQGTFANLYPKTQIAFYPNGTSISEMDTTVPIATGEVVRSNEIEAYVDHIQMTAGKSTKDLLNTWAYVTKWVISDQVLRIRLDMKVGNLQKAVQDRLSKNQNFMVVPSDIVKVTLHETDSLVEVYDHGGLLVHTFGKVARAEDIAGDVESFLLNYQRFITLRKLAYANEQVKVKWDIYKSKCSSRCEPLSQPIPREPGTNLYNLVQDECFGIEITNSSSNEVFFSIIDFAPNHFEDNTDMILIPPPGLSPTAFSIKAGKTWKSSDFDSSYCFQFGTASNMLGKETLKLVTSLKPIQLREAVKTRSVAQDPESVESENVFDVQDIHIVVGKKE